MADLFGGVDKAAQYAPRLRELAQTKRKPTEADVKALESILEERNTLYEFLRTLRRLRSAEKEIDRYITKGIKARGLDVAQSNANRLRAEIDAKLLEFIGNETT